MFACVNTTRHTESEVKVETFNDLIFEVVSFHHSKAVDGLVTNREFNAENKVEVIRKFWIFSTWLLYNG